MYSTRLNFELVFSGKMQISFLPSPFSASSSSILWPVSSSFRPPPPSARPQFTASSTLSTSSGSGGGVGSSSVMDYQPKKLIDFPYLSTPQRKLMIDLVSTMENRLESELQPCNLPPDVQYYHNQSRNSQGSLLIRSGNTSSQVDFILGNWLYCELPAGGAINIATITSFLKSSTDAPNFLIELVQTSPTSLIFVLDLIPRKDLVLYPEYLQTFYVDTRLDELRKAFLNSFPEVQTYNSVLNTRIITSPSSIVIRIDTTEKGGPERLEEIIKDHVDPITREVLTIWLDQCACGKRNVVLDEAEKEILVKRDGMIKANGIEIDLCSSYPRLFGDEVGNRIINAILEVYNA